MIDERARYERNEFGLYSLNKEFSALQPFDVSVIL